MFIVFFILILVVLIIVHEFGHFIVAKLFRIRVDEFGIFFPPKLFGKKFGETEYTFNLLPLGGFVRIFGENYDEGHGVARSFVSKPRYIQAAVIVAGILFNLIFAWFVLSAGYMAGLPTPVDHIGYGQVQNVQVLVTSILPGSPADKAGIAAGDQILQVQTATNTLTVATSPTPQSTSEADTVTTFITSHVNDSVGLTVLRDGQQKLFLVRAADGVVMGRKAIGVELDDVGTLKLNPIAALGEGALLGWNITESTASGLLGFFKQIFTATANFNEVSGPIGITVYGAAAIKQGFAAAAVLTALISINLALINIVPIPGLDGGRLLIIIIEAIIRRPVNPTIVMRLTLAGFALLITLMIVVSYHDIAKLVG
ncbi:MAG TPA: M50 family metallopeptidase [Candidatus Paceibacterota bacterium]|nr:M50 family metallopeptidase [Candidatus Paceibacterota bacterium]